MGIEVALNNAQMAGLANVNPVRPRSFGTSTSNNRFQSTSFPPMGGDTATLGMNALDFNNPVQPPQPTPDTRMLMSNPSNPFLQAFASQAQPIKNSRGNAQTDSSTQNDGSSSSGTSGTGKKKKAFTLLDTIQLELFGTTKNHPNWMAFYGKVCGDDEKPVKVAPAESFVMCDSLYQES